MFDLYQKELDRMKVSLPDVKSFFDNNKDKLSAVDTVIYKELIHLAEETLENSEYNSDDAILGHNTQLATPGGIRIDNLFRPTTGKRYPCCMCKKVYTSYHGLKYHYTHGHTPRESALKPYVCPVPNCRKTYKNSNGLKYHLDKCHSNSQ